MSDMAPASMPVENVFFDLDGTLVDSSATISACIDYAMAEVGVERNSVKPVRSLIGAPLLDIFRVEFGLDGQRVDRAIDLYRERYDAMEQAGTRVYDGVLELLSALRDVGGRLFIATVKPTEIAEKVLSDLGLDAYFDGVSGSSMDHIRRDKAGIIAHALGTWGLDASRSTMIGDREQDIQGARKNGMGAIAVTWGFGSRDELDAAGPDHMVDHASDIFPLLVNPSETPQSNRQLKR